ncbi:MAG: 16S rRNA (guanine527-N7)-methyltransferase GidB [Rhodobacteraceae bacterium HLUCCA08]|nr:MAG: 16S rRNA (guanine527-N7)-methyltransferase GidB [Rhodobacteraceae bacterium HLUCCA08]
MPAGAANVSRETEAKLAAYADLLRKWTRKINLVSRATLDDLEHRHIVDSAQLLDCAPMEWEHWVDLGSGGGLPGLVIAIHSVGSGRHITLVESDQRKAAFLRTVIRELALPAKVSVGRVADQAPLRADVISARALAPLTTLLRYAEKHLSPDGTAVFPKGRTVADEIATARTEWSFALTKLPSKTSPDSVILRIEDIHRA